jgi:hypothetical protein
MRTLLCLFSLSLIFVCGAAYAEPEEELLSPTPQAAAPKSGKAETVPAQTQVSEWINSKCETGCRSALDQCAATSNKVMETALKETTVYAVGTAERAKVDIKFESAFQKAEACWDKYYICAAKCAPPKRCINACQSTFRKCFAAGDAKTREGLRQIKALKTGTPEWQAAYAKGDADIDACLEHNRNCKAKCANP